MSETEEAASSGTVRSRPTWAIVALAFSLVGTAGSLYLSLGLGLKACPLCFYQRSFMMGTFAVLALGLAVDRRQPRLYCLLSLPLAFAGGGVALFHEYLVVTGVLECPEGLLGLGSSPVQSLASFTLTVTAVVAGVLASGSGPWSRGVPISGATILGLLLAWASIAGSPPLPPAPKAPYDSLKQPLDMCRPPYRPGSRLGRTERH
jgi:disulfide bond formation protein DsbB